MQRVFLTVVSLAFLVASALLPGSPAALADEHGAVSAQDVVNRDALAAFVLRAQSVVEAAEDEAALDAVLASFRTSSEWKSSGIYLFLLTTEGVNRLHGAQPELEGTDLSDLEDSNGVLIVQELIAAAQAGGGYVEYLFDDPEIAGEDESPKVSYAVRVEIAGGEQVLGAGFYPVQQSVIKTYTVGTQIASLELPVVTGGTPPLTYSIEPALPSGLQFDAATRILSGTPTAPSAAAEYSYTVVDGVGARLSLPLFSIAVQTPAIEPLGVLTYEVGTAISPITLPEITGGTPPLTYSIEPALPSGLQFDAATRILSGTPLAPSAVVDYSYTVVDGAGARLSLPLFSLEVQASVVEPLGALTYEVGTAIAPITLPEVTGGGTPPFTYALTPALPAGLVFDAATRTISGTPTEVTSAAEYAYVATDAANARLSLPPFSIEIVLPPLDAPDALVAEDYKGADGSGDQGGFLLLSWDLSDHHDALDGYRIFRQIPSLGDEMIPWALVDAVPGVEMGRAIVATLDNVSTRWGIAAESDGRTTHVVSAKAVLLEADSQPYELMAETLLASREAARVGDAPVFAALLPQALAFAQGATPRLQSVAGEIHQSAITVTEEAVRAIDNIAPDPVPALSALDAPGDEGSRIALTWTRSPSDQLVQGAVGAVGPAAVGPIAGVQGYGIYRRAAGEDEFVRVGQVGAGVTSFVDETALNGVRYTYQIRPYDLDNETAGEVDETALAVRNIAVDSEGRAIFGLFGADHRVGFDDFFILADLFGLMAEDAAFDPAFDLAPNAAIDFDDFFVLADNFGRSVAGAAKSVPMQAGLNADARLYLDALTALPKVGEEFVVEVRLADFAAIKGYGLQVQYDADRLAFVQARTDQPLGAGALAEPQVLANEAGVVQVAAHGEMVSEGEVALSLVFRPTAEIESAVIEITDSQTYDSVGLNRLALPAPVALQTRPEVFALANNYPNPFNPATTIKYALPQAADVELTVYNVVGQAVRTLVAEHQGAGRYAVEWDATNDHGQHLSSGMYFYHLQAGDFREVRKMLLLK